MLSFHNGSVEIAFIDEGEGEPIVLVHGFGSTAGTNWVYPGWVSALTKAGRRVVALDNRGHGASSKLYDRAEYSLDIMAGDVRALMDHLNIERADIMGYSLGSRNSCRVALHHPERLRSLIIGGLGSLWGTLAGGVILGVAQTLGAAVNPQWQILAGHLAFLAVLVIKPRGLFPRAVD